MSEFICKVARDKFNTQKSTVFLCTSDEQEEANLKHRFGNRRRNSVGTRSAGPASGRRTGQARGETGSADAGRSSPQGRTAPGLAAESREGGTPELPPCVNRTSIFQKVRNLHTEPRKTWLTSHVRGLWGAVLSGSQCPPPTYYSVYQIQPQNSSRLS